MESRVVDCHKSFLLAIHLPAQKRPQTLRIIASYSTVCVELGKRILVCPDDDFTAVLCMFSQTTLMTLSVVLNFYLGGSLIILVQYVQFQAVITGYAVGTIA